MTDPYLVWGQPAGSAVKPCPLDKVQKPKTFCDVDNISLSVALADAKGQPKTVTVSNALPTVWGATPLVLKFDPEVRKLFDSHSVVVLLEADFASPEVRNGGGGGQVDKGNMVDKRRAKCAVKTAAAQHCAKHPMIIPWSKTQSSGVGPTNPPIELSISAVSYDYTEFFTRLFKWEGFSELCSPATAEQTFYVASCGAPASGKPRRAFKALARLTALDDWRIEYSRQAGFSIGMSKSASKSVYKDGGVSTASSSTTTAMFGGGDYKDTRSSSSRTAADGTKLVQSSSESTADFTGASSTFSTSAKQESASLTSGASANPVVAQRYNLAAVKLSEEFFDQDPPSKAAKAKAWLSERTKTGKASLTISRNGQELSTADIDGMIKRVTDTIESVQEATKAVGDLVRGGVKAAAPASITASFDFSLQLLAGAAQFRHWRVPGKPLTGAAYYIDTSDTRWTFGLHLTLAQATVTVAIEGQVKFVAAWVASVTLTIEVKLSGKADVGFDVGKGDAACVVGGTGWFSATVTGTLDVTALTFYGKAQVQLVGGVRYRLSATFDTRDMRVKRSQLRSERTTFTVIVTRGNKLSEFFGYSEAPEGYHWPEDGPLVLMETGKFTKNFV